MYSRKHGKSGSKRPLRDKTPGWVRYKKKEVEQLVLKLAGEDKSCAEIGLILRDQYGIPNIREAAGRKVTAILRDSGISPQYPEDMMNLMRKALKIKEHLERHRHDPFAIRGLELTESKIRRLGKYYRKRGVLPENWKYDPQKLNLIVNKSK
jgi:small subunit ribosomal protein S15